MQSLDRRQEADRLLAMYEGSGSADRLMTQLSSQMNVLHNRAQVLLTLSGVVITVTGFSGRIIAGTSLPAQMLIIAGLVLVLVAAALCVFGVLPVRWLSQLPGQDTKDWLTAALGYRDAKTRAYRASMAVLLAGMGLYVASIAIMLLRPAVHALG